MVSDHISNSSPTGSRLFSSYRRWSWKIDILSMQPIFSGDCHGDVGNKQQHLYRLHSKNHPDYHEQRAITHK